MAIEIVDAEQDAGQPKVALVPPAAFTRDQAYFPDQRPGVDRWGTQRAGKIACGTGWGPDEHVCPLYVAEACPGERNVGTRWEASSRPVCDLLCGACGGGGRTETTDFCGHPRGAPMVDYAIWEMGGSLRLDQFTAPAIPKPPPAKWPQAFAPTMEWGGKNWVQDLHNVMGGNWPMIFTTAKTAAPGNRKTPTLLRDRLGGYEGMLGVNGLVKDDLLDDCWEIRHELIDFCARSGVDIMVTWQLSYYDDAETAGWIYNVARAFELYRLFVEAGFSIVALDVPPFVMPWLAQEYLDFIDRAKVKCIAISLQTFSKIHPLQLRAFAQLNEALERDAAVIVFGVNTVPVFAKVAAAFRGRSVVFSNVEPYAKAAFFRLLDDRRSPAGWSKGFTFAYNAKTFEDRAAAVLHAVNDQENSGRRGSTRRTPRPRRSSRRSSRR